MTSIYLHIPFCQRICSYCDFPKRVSKSSEIDRYLVALEKEIQMYNVKTAVSTLYIGGGTPSILNECQLKKLHDILCSFHLTSNYEMTIECNPEHITKEKLILYKNMGINRISLGVQSFNNLHLKLLNRNHTKEMVFEAIKLIKKYINNISIDLMFSIPFQTIEDLEEDLRIIRQLDIPHLSAYSLILEEKTVFEKWLSEKKISLVDNEVEAQMFQIVLESLKDMGYTHYEISNFAKNDFQSKHNKVYWQNMEYYGFGMGASGYIDSVRYYNEHLVSEYIKKIENGLLPIERKDVLSREEKIKEELLLGLRLLKGVSISEINHKYQIDVLKYFNDELEFLHNKHWIEISDHISLTHTGLFYGNEVFEQFV